MRLALAPKVEVVEEDKEVAKEDMVAVAEDEGVAVTSNHRHTTHITIRRIVGVSKYHKYMSKNS
jgi:hypothetical protein